LGIATEKTAGPSWQSTAAGLIVHLGGVFGIGRFHDAGVALHGAISYFHGIEGGLNSSIASPDGTSNVDAGRAEVASYWRVAPEASLELHRTDRIMWRVGLGWAWTSYNLGNEILANNLSGYGPELHLGPRFVIARHFAVDVLFSPRVDFYSYDRHRYTLVPGQLTSDTARGHTVTLGLEAAMVRW
jgi:hypothetical protein